MDVQILQVELEKQVILMLLLDHPKRISYEIQQKLLLLLQVTEMDYRQISSQGK